MLSCRERQLRQLSASLGVCSALHVLFCEAAGSCARMKPLLLRYAAFARRHAAALEALETVVQACATSLGSCVCASHAWRPPRSRLHGSHQRARLRISCWKRVRARLAARLRHGALDFA